MFDIIMILFFVVTIGYSLISTVFFIGRNIKTFVRRRMIDKIYDMMMENIDLESMGLLETNAMKKLKVVEFAKTIPSFPFPHKE